MHPPFPLSVFPTLAFATLTASCVGAPPPPPEATTDDTTGITAPTSTTSDTPSLPATSTDGSTSASSDFGASSTTSAESSSTDTSSPPTNAPPVTHDDGPYIVFSDELLEAGEVAGVLFNDVDPEGATLMVSDHDPVSAKGGTVTMIANGSFTYEPPPDLPFGSDHFHYTVTDDEGLTASARVRVVVQAAGASVVLDTLGVKGIRIQGIDGSDQSGRSVSGAGDIDGNGHADLVIGAPGGAGMTDMQNSTGEAYVVYGDAGLPNTVNLEDPAVVTLVGASGYDQFGQSVAMVGDFDGDGFADVMAGAPYGDDGWTNAGETNIYYGEASPIDPNKDVRLNGISLNSHSGQAVASAGDVDGDGYDDVLVGAPEANIGGLSAVGQAYLVFGASSFPGTYALASASPRFEGIEQVEFAGQAVSTAGDVDGDGRADILIGAPGASSNAGATYLVFGAPAQPNETIGLAAADVRFHGTEPGGQSGCSVSAAGDVNGDGYGDVIIGASMALPDDTGESYVVYGGPALVGPSVYLSNADVRLQGIDAYDYAGHSVSTAGDFDGDGYDDMLVGAYNASPNGSQSGEVYLILGGPSLPAARGLLDADLRFEGITIDNGAGYSVAAAGDVDGDGFDDIVIGAPWAGAGETYVVFGDDIDAHVTELGTEGDDVLVATHGPDDDIIIAGRGDDTLTSDGGSDVLRGGQGDDTFVIMDDQFFRVNGGLGSDTLELGAADLTLALTAMDAHRITGIERLRLSTVGPSDLYISELDLLGLSKTSNTLEIEGDADDDVTITTGTWDGPTDEGGIDVYTSTSTAAVIAVDPSVGIVFLF
jgi:hypothetical protein